MKQRIGGIILSFALLAVQPVEAAGPKVQVYKTRTCGCCGKWVDHLKANGFEPVVTNVESTAEYRQKLGVPEGMQSCHTAVVNGYTVEGHVPAADIHKLLKSRVKAKGLAVPGMPLGSPGMEAPRPQAYQVLLFQANGKSIVFNSYPGAQ